MGRCAKLFYSTDTEKQTLHRRISPADEQIDSIEKFRLLPDVIMPLKRLADAGYELVMVSNQDGLGTASFPEETFWPPQNLLLHILETQGIRFAAIRIDRHFAHQASDTRKPKVGMMLDYLADPSWDRARSAVIGDRDTDLQFAVNLGVAGIRCGPNGLSWPQIARQLLDAPRTATVQRNTKETRIEVSVDLDAETPPEISTGLGFFDHMLDQLARHSLIDLTIRAKGDLHIDDHHTVEDVGIALGQALAKALGDKRGIRRYGHFRLAMDDAQIACALDLSARPYLIWTVDFPTAKIGTFDTELVREFFQALSTHGGITLHVDKIHGLNSHHIAEAAFKAVARALREAVEPDPRLGNALPSTKGAL